MVLTDGPRKMLFDHGMTPSDPPEYPLPPPPHLDAAFFTHAHLDHIGMAPIVGRNGTKVIVTSMTGQLAELMLEDAMKVARLEGYSSRYSLRDLNYLLDNMKTVEAGGVAKVSGAEVALTPAGHVPGATMFLYRGSKDVLFTGDVQTHPSHLVGEAKALPCEVLIMESTYADREHPNRGTTEESLCQAVERVVEGGGQVVVPAFAMGRSQELMMILANKGFEIWMDGMARAVNDIYAKNPSALRDSRAFRRALSGVRIVEDPRDRFEAQKYADVIITPSGMLDGGPALHYLGAIARDPQSALFLTGYQVEGSNGRELVEKGTLTVGGVTIRPTCQVKSFDFSAHAGHAELLELARACNPKKILLMHGDKRELLKADLEKDFEVILPTNGDPITI
jgi:putative mRNA 3-end processing factor